MLKTGMIIAERYEILGKIGTGGMADVYKAKDHKLNRFVAVKVLKPEFREDTTFIRKFRSEAQAAAGLTHPNIVNVFDVGDDEGVYYIVMELIEGITLKEYIAKKGKLSIKEATSIAIQVSMGLEAAHNHGIVHRDVKPQISLFQQMAKSRLLISELQEQRPPILSVPMLWGLYITAHQNRYVADIVTKRVIFIHSVLLYMKWLPDVFRLTETQRWQSQSNIFRKKWFRRACMRKNCHTALSRLSLNVHRRV